MSDDSPGCGCFGCLISVAFLLLGAAFVVFAWKVLMFAWGM